MNNVKYECVERWHVHECINKLLARKSTQISSTQKHIKPCLIIDVKLVIFILRTNLTTFVKFRNFELAKICRICCQF